MLVSKYRSHVIDGQNSDTRYDCMLYWSGHDSILAFPPPSPPPPPTNPTLPYKDGVSEIRNVFIVAANVTFTPYNGLHTLFIYLLLNT